MKKEEIVKEREEIVKEKEERKNKEIRKTK